MKKETVKKKKDGERGLEGGGGGGQKNQVTDQKGIGNRLEGPLRIFGKSGPKKISKSIGG